jgi:putative hydrolase of the HAD superfamily
LTPPGAETFAAFCRRINAPPEPLARAMVAVAQDCGTDDVMAPLDTPLLSEAEWSRRVMDACARFGCEVDLSHFAEKWFAGQSANQPMLDYLHSLRGRVRFLGLLSNMTPGFEPYWRAMASPETLFDGLVLSHLEGTRKPDASIYRLAARRADTPAANCVLIDDLEGNCAGARAAGWRAIHFTGTEEAISRLDALIDETYESRPSEED